MPGWNDTIQTRHLTTPIKTDDRSLTDVASVVTWPGGKIGPGQYGESKILAQGLPTDTDVLVFKALQTYGNGTTVAWIGTQVGRRTSCTDDRVEGHHNRANMQATALHT